MTSSPASAARARLSSNGVPYRSRRGRPRTPPRRSRCGGWRGSRRRPGGAACAAGPRAPARAPSVVLLDRNVDPVAARPPRRRPGCGASSSSRSRCGRRDAFSYSISSLAPLRAVAAPSPTRPLERAQLARARPPDPLRFVHAPVESASANQSRPLRLAACAGSSGAYPPSRSRSSTSCSHAENPLIRQSEEHDSGWGMAVYRQRRQRAARARPLPRGRLQRRRVPARHLDARAHLQRAPAARDARRPDAREHAPVRDGRVLVLPQRDGDPLSRSCSSPGVGRPQGETDSEHLFNWLMCHFDSSRPARVAARSSSGRASSARRSPASTSSSRTASSSTRTSSGSSSCTGSCGRGRRSSRRRSSRRTSAGTPCSRTSCSCSTRTTPRTRTPSASWVTTCVAAAEIEKFEQGQHLRGDARGKFAAERAARVAAGTAE